MSRHLPTFEQRHTGSSRQITFASAPKSLGFRPSGPRTSDRRLSLPRSRPNETPNSSAPGHGPGPRLARIRRESRRYADDRRTRRRPAVQLPARRIHCRRPRSALLPSYDSCVAGGSIEVQVASNQRDLEHPFNYKASYRLVSKGPSPFVSTFPWNVDHLRDPKATIPAAHHPDPHLGHCSTDDHPIRVCRQPIMCCPAEHALPPYRLSYRIDRLHPAADAVQPHRS